MLLGEDGGAPTLNATFSMDDVTLLPLPPQPHVVQGDRLAAEGEGVRDVRRVVRREDLLRACLLDSNPEYRFLASGRTPASPPQRRAAQRQLEDGARLRDARALAGGAEEHERPPRLGEDVAAGGDVRRARASARRAPSRRASRARRARAQAVGAGARWHRRLGVLGPQRAAAPSARRSPRRGLGGRRAARRAALRRAARAPAARARPSGPPVVSVVRPCRARATRGRGGGRAVAGRGGRGRRAAIFSCELAQRVIASGRDFALLSAGDGRCRGVRRAPRAILRRLSWRRRTWVARLRLTGRRGLSSLTAKPRNSAGAVRRPVRGARRRPRAALAQQASAARRRRAHGMTASARAAADEGAGERLPGSRPSCTPRRSSEAERVAAARETARRAAGHALRARVAAARAAGRRRRAARPHPPAAAAGAPGGRPRRGGGGRRRQAERARAAREAEGLRDQLAAEAELHARAGGRAGAGGRRPRRRRRREPPAAAARGGRERRLGRAREGGGGASSNGRAGGGRGGGRGCARRRREGGRQAEQAAERDAA